MGEWERRRMRRKPKKREIEGERDRGGDRVKSRGEDDGEREKSEKWKNADERIQHEVKLKKEIECLY